MKCILSIRRCTHVRKRRIFLIPSAKQSLASVGFVPDRIDYELYPWRLFTPSSRPNMILAGAPKSVTDRLQRVLNAAARLVSGTRKYDRGLSQILHADLHWLDVADRVRYKLAVTVHRCLHNKAPKYLADCCVAVFDIAGRQRLRSAHRRQLDVLRHQRSTLGRRAFSVAVIRFQTNWDTALKTVVLGSHWKHCFSADTSVPSASEAYLYTRMRYINRRFTYLLTYLNPLGAPYLDPVTLRLSCAT